LECGDGLLALLEVAAAKENVVGSRRLQEGLDGLITNASIGASDEDDSGGGHVAV